MCIELIIENVNIDNETIETIQFTCVESNRALTGIFHLILRKALGISGITSSRGIGSVEHL